VRGASVVRPGWRNARTLIFTALLALCAGLLGAAPASATPGYVEIAVQGANESLWVYWQQDGTSTWYSHEVAGEWTTSSPPVLEIQPNGNAAIAAAGPEGALDFYWGPVAGTSWHDEVAAPDDSVCNVCTPALGTQRALSGLPAPDVVIAASATDDMTALNVYTQPAGGQNWSAQTIPGSQSSGSYQPTLAIEPDNSIVVASEVYDEGWGFSRQSPGSSSWSTVVVTADSFEGDDPVYDAIPVAAESDGNSVVTWIDQASSTQRFMWNPQGSPDDWYEANVTATGAADPLTVPSIAVTPTGVAVTSTTSNECLYSYSEPDGGTVWTPDKVSCSDPGGLATLAAQPDGNLVIASATIQNGLIFYWKASGSTTWNPETIPGTSGTVYDMGASIALSPTTLY
jgi:hypothetical protein